jgi:hypothetical protein
MKDDVYFNPGSDGFETFINDFGRIIISQECPLHDTLEAIQLTAEEAEELAGYLLILAKKLKE